MWVRERAFNELCPVMSKNVRIIHVLRPAKIDKDGYTVRSWEELTKRCEMNEGKEVCSRFKQSGCLVG